MELLPNLKASKVPDIFPLAFVVIINAPDSATNVGDGTVKVRALPVP